MTKHQSKIEKLIAKFCPNGVEFKELGKICKVLRGKRLTKKELSNEYQYPVFHGGLIPLGCYNKYNRKANQTMVINTGSVGEVVWSPVDFWSSDGTFTIKTSNGINDRFIYFFLKCQETYLKSQKREGGVPTINREAVAKIKIPLPPLAVQEEIVKILNSFTELEAELEARKKQYEYYREKLLTFGDNIRLVELIDIANYSKTRIAANELNTESYVGVDNLLQNKQGKTVSDYVPKTGKLTRYEIGDILIGNIRPYLKKIWHATNIGGINGDVLVVHINEMEENNFSSDFLYHLLASDKFFSYNMQTAKGAKMPRGNKSSIMKYKIPVPSLKEQERIVLILDKFDALVNDLPAPSADGWRQAGISIGLPAELSARRSQYEYYRGKLLDFKPLSGRI